MADAAILAISTVPNTTGTYCKPLTTRSDKFGDLDTDLGIDLSIVTPLLL
jgi:hypothetical protein